MMFLSSIYTIYSKYRKHGLRHSVGKENSIKGLVDRSDENHTQNENLTASLALATFYISVNPKERSYVYCVLLFLFIVKIRALYVIARACEFRK